MNAATAQANAFQRTGTERLSRETADIVVVPPSFC
jgi:hypothetical protein